MTIKAREDVTLSLVIVVITYVICQIPNPCRAFFIMTTENLGCGSPYNIFWPWAFNAAMLNSAVNFVILALCGKKFRKKAKATICFWNKVKVSPQSLETIVNYQFPRTGDAERIGSGMP